MCSRLLFGTMVYNRVFVASRWRSLSWFVIGELARVFMSSTYVVLSVGSEDVRRVPCLDLLECIEHICLGYPSSCGLHSRGHVVLCSKVEHSGPYSENGASTSSADEAMLDWLVVSVRCEWTPKEVPVWFSPIFCALLYHMRVLRRGDPSGICGPLMDF
jgi:hypothetical protein